MYVSKKMKEALKKMPCKGRDAHRSTFKALRKAGLAVGEAAPIAFQVRIRFRRRNHWMHLYSISR